MQRIGIGKQQPLGGVGKILRCAKPQRGILAGKAVAPRRPFLRAQRVYALMLRCVQFRDTVRAVRRAIVDDEDMPVLTQHKPRLRLLYQRIQTAGQVSLLIPRGNQHGQRVR